MRIAMTSPAPIVHRPGSWGSETHDPDRKRNLLLGSGQEPVGGRGSLDGSTEAAIIAASLDEPALFDLVFRRHFPSIHRYLRRRVGLQLADELAAETFAVAFAHRSTFDPDHGEARPWLFGIAANLVRNHRRAERRQLIAYSRTGIDPIVPDAIADADSRMDAVLAMRRVAKGLASMSEADREVLLLFAWANLSYEQIAAALDVPIGTVRSRLSRARRRIRELLGADGQVPEGRPTFGGDP
jgi:RNA polymerase sigma factor (sigma-70 family)